MKYKLIKADLWLRDKLIPEGTTFEFSQADAVSLSEYLKPINSATDNSTKPKVNKSRKHLVKETTNEN